MEGKTIKNEIEQIYNVYKACQSGKREELAHLFKVDDAGKVSFSYTCLEKIVARAKDTYSNPEKQTKEKHKKFYDGAFDVSDIRETAYLIITEVFYEVPNSDRCIVIDGRKSQIPINDGNTLLQNIAYYLDVMCNEKGSLAYKDVPENVKVTNKDNDTSLVSLFDWQPPNKLRQTVDGGIALRRECAEALRLFQNDMPTVFSLFNSDSISVKAVIKTILENEQSFYKCDGLLEMIEQAELCDLVESYTGIRIWKNNLSNIIAIIKARLLRYLYIIPEQHEYIFGRDNMEVFNFCLQYKDWQEFRMKLCKHDDFIFWWNDRFEETKDQKSLLACDPDLKNPARVAEEWAKQIITWLEIEEVKWLINLSQRYTIKTLEGNIKYWNCRYNKSSGQIKLFFYSGENIKHPREVKVAADGTVVYQGCTQYYICDSRKGVAYVLPKNCRKNIKLNCKKAA